MSILTTLTATLYSFNRPKPANGVTKYIMKNRPQSTSYAVLYKWDVVIPSNATRIGVHMMHPQVAVHFGGNISTVKHCMQKEVILTSLVCFAFTTPNISSVVALLNVANGLHYGQIYAFPCQDSNAESLPATNENWLTVSEIKRGYDGWSIDGLAPIYAPKFAAVNGVNRVNTPPFDFTTTEIRKCELAALAAIEEELCNLRISSSSKTLDAEIDKDKIEALSKTITCLESDAARLKSDADNEINTLKATNAGLAESNAALTKRLEKMMKATAAITNAFVWIDSAYPAE